MTIICTLFDLFAGLFGFKMRANKRFFTPFAKLFFDVPQQ